MKRMTIILCALALIGLAVWAQARTTVVVVGQGAAAEGGIANEFDIAGATYYAVAPEGYTYSGTQTTNYSTRKYNTLSAAEAALTASPSAPQVINIIGSWSSSDTTAVTIDGTTTSAANYILVRALDTARHAAIWSTSKYNLATTNETALTIKDDYVQIDGLQITAGGTSGAQVGLYIPAGLASSNQITISNCIIKGGTNSGDITSGVRGIWISDGSFVYPNVNVYNTIIYDWYLRDYPNSSLDYTTGVYDEYSNSTKLYNVTISNCGKGVKKGSYGSLVYRNTIVNEGNANYVAHTGDHTTATYSVSSDGTLPAGTGVATCTPTFAGAGDYHLGGGDTCAKDTGTSSVDSLYTTDIDGDTRTGTWDIGADEI